MRRADIDDPTRQLAARFRRHLEVGGISWTYHRVGIGAPLLWLTGGLRRAALAWPFLARLARTHAVVAPDYPPVGSADQIVAGLDAMLAAESIDRAVVVGQSYGGLLAQVFTAMRPGSVGALILSSTGAANYGRVWLPAEWLAIGLIRLLPERWAKAALARALEPVPSGDGPQRSMLRKTIRDTLERDLTRADMISHFAVAADWIRRDIVRPAAYEQWPGRVTVLAAENDPTQNASDRARFQSLFGRPVEFISLGALGHGAVMTDPEHYAEAVVRAAAAAA